MDLADFQMVRAPRRSEPDTDQRITLDSPLIYSVGNLLRKGAPIDFPDIVDLLEKFTALNTDPIFPIDNPDTYLDWVKNLISDLERWFVSKDDRVTAEEFAAELADLKKAFANSGAQVPWNNAVETYREVLHSWILVWLVSAEPPLDNLATATRFALVVAHRGRRVG